MNAVSEPGRQNRVRKPGELLDEHGELLDEHGELWICKHNRCSDDGEGRQWAAHVWQKLQDRRLVFQLFC